MESIANTTSSIVVKVGATLSRLY